MRILVVDDYAPFALSLRVLLSEHDVVTAGGGRAALDVLRGDGAFDAILCDLRLRDMPGAELYAAIAVERPELAGRVAFMTGGAGDADTEEFLDRAGRPCLQKPFSAADVVAVLRDCAGGGA